MGSDSVYICLICRSSCTWMSKTSFVLNKPFLSVHAHLFSLSITKHLAAASISCRNYWTFRFRKLLETAPQFEMDFVLGKLHPNLRWIFVFRNRILSLQQVAKNQIRLNLSNLLRQQILLQRQRFSQKFSSIHMKRFVAATCRRDMLLQLVT